ncbi:polysaccharide deacetylase family protein [Deinococcus yavapaiensis]|uniref:Peptidoglycan/xylan/chitin deacetylase (PgdA/CDA1 family) n=1 Tax=Deinococcus yavapaiensis KR-236 TaxID=694435 RepID=A0A318SHQ1_9DEIO|nr:polysaccharide deacetylase family protein [Deinococcus yavapaiensis]PYE53496.1 peptidoglycan/xylan/chitin deacetylase (PgdA/CDA1 family) [Deinococcus yavapaiensis KR-236]
MKRLSAWLKWRPDDGVAAVSLASYFLLPYLLVQVGNVGLLRRGRDTATSVALTFDDGPDPASTPFVLDALKKAGVKATFFVVAERMERFPDLARRLVEEGHEVGLHCYTHRHAWLRSPWDFVYDLWRACATFEQVLGFSPALFRPPHGAYTLVAVLALRLEGLRGVHWTVMGNDWVESMTPERIVRRILAHLEPGGTMVLHDAGPGANHCVLALPLLLDALREAGLCPGPVGDLPNVRPERLGDLRPRLARLLRVVTR